VIEVTGTAQQAAWAAREHPPVEQVRPGLWSIPVPLPNHSLRYTIVYAFELTSGLAIVDAGWDTPVAWDALNAGLAAAGGSMADVRTVLITHVHPDHYGLAGRVRDASGAAIAMHKLEAGALPTRFGGIERLVEAGADWLRQAGAGEDEAVALIQASRDLNHLFRMVEPDHLLADGQLLDLPGWQLRTVWTPGHTPGHLCFHEERTGVLLSGDHVLPRISPNISANAQQPPDPLRAFLESLRKVRDLPVGEVLPAHEYRFAGLPDRVDDLLDHHEERLAELRGLIGQRPGSTTLELAERLTWRRAWSDIRDFHRRAAVGETLAHLELLASRGQAEPGPGPVDHWVLTAAAGALGESLRQPGATMTQHPVG
jgi:glyoxylase-like metal-dependent hydrolase (beta-lactamase superfamily II)